LTGTANKSYKFLTPLFVKTQNKQSRERETITDRMKERRMNNMYRQTKTELQAIVNNRF